MSCSAFTFRYGLALDQPGLHRLGVQVSGPASMIAAMVGDVVEYMRAARMAISWSSPRPAYPAACVAMTPAMR